MKKECKKCEHEWVARSETRPLCCPNCKSRNWDVGGYLKCEACLKNYLETHTHHIDGDTKNNNKDNLIRVCRHCHGYIHKGFRQKKGTASRCTTSKLIYNRMDVSFRINQLRKKWLGLTKEVVKE